MSPMILLAAEAACDTEVISWPAAAVLIVGILATAFLCWVVFR